MALVCTLAAGALVLGACSSSGSGSSSPGNGSPDSALPASGAHSGSGSSAVSAATLKQLQAKVDKAKQVPEFVPPGPPVDAASVKGKTVYALPISNQIDTCNRQVEIYVALGKKLGLKVINFHTSGDPTQWATGVQNAIARHADVLALFCSINPGAIGPQLKTARKAGIKIIAGNANYNGVPTSGQVDAVTSVQAAQGMQTAVDSAVLRLDGKPLHALVVSSKLALPGIESVKSIKKEVASVCGDVGCSVEKVVDIAPQDWASKTEGEVSSALLANPKINAVLVVFDGMSTFAITGAQQAKRSDVPIYTWGTSASTVKLMVGKPDGILQADAGPSVTWDAYVEMDQTIRLLDGKPAAPAAKEVAPNRFWTPDNAAGFLTSSGGYNEKGYGAPAFQNGFRKLWGLPPLGS